MFAWRVRRLTISATGSSGYERIKERANAVLEMLLEDNDDLMVALVEARHLWHEAAAVADDWAMVFYPDGERCCRAIRSWGDAFEVVEVTE